MDQHTSLAERFEENRAQGQPASRAGRRVRGAALRLRPLDLTILGP